MLKINKKTGITERFFLLCQYLIPHYLISKLFNYFSRSQIPLLKNWMISRFIKLYGIDLKEAKLEDPLAYSSFNMFFTRALKNTARPIFGDDTCIVSPADGVISQFGQIHADRIFQAKNHPYSLTELLGGNSERAKPFLKGTFLTIYISPKDYHRVHMPFGGKLQEMVHIPGRLFPVNPIISKNVQNLFSRNKRVVCFFHTKHGPMALILIGAMIVSSIETVWSNSVVPDKDSIYSICYENQRAIYLGKGEEMGRFRMGSTVIAIFGSSMNITWLDTLSIDQSIHMGNALAVFSK